MTSEKDEHLGLHDNWKKGRQFKREPKWQKLVELNRWSVVDTGNGLIAVAALLILGLSLASIAFNNEAFLLRLRPSVDAVKQ